MIDKMIVYTISSFVCVLAILLIIYGVYVIGRNLEDRIPRKWIIKSFCDEDSWYNSLKKKWYIFIINLNRLADNIFYSFKIRCLKYAILIAIILLIRLIIAEMLEKHSDKLVKLYNDILNWNMKILNLSVSFRDLKWIILIAIALLGVKKYYRDKIRKSLKEDYYKEIIEEYLKVKDALIDIIITNMSNEKVLYRVIQYDYEELREVSEHYNRKIFNYLNTDIFNEEYKDVEKHISSRIPRVNELEEHKFNSEYIVRFGQFFRSKSRYIVMYSINKKLERLMDELGRKTIYVIDKEGIIKGFMRSYEVSMRKILENDISISIVKNIEVLNIIYKIDKKIGLYTKENSIYEFLKKVK